jgi:DNA-binding winged helix-turn-helix (wHTH) protein
MPGTHSKSMPYSWLSAAEHVIPAVEEALMQDFSPFRLDTVNQCLWRRRETAQDERILLSPKAFAVLRYLVEHAGRLVTQEELLEAAWPETHVQPEVLKSRIFEVRSALGDRPKTPRFIETLPRRGYRFIAAIRDSPPAHPVEPVQSAPSRLVGRERVLGALRDCLHQALRNQRQIVLLTGEPGLGKTTLVDAFLQQAAADVPDMRIAARAMHRGLRRQGSLLTNGVSFLQTDQ